MLKANTKSTLVINETTLNTGINLKERATVHASNLWHKIYVQHATKYSREFVLRTIMSAVDPLDFIPVSYSIEDDYVTFMLKNCGSAIDKMCMLNLTIPHPEAHKNLPSFKITIYLKHAHASELRMGIQSNISKILQKRFNTQTKTLNLDYFMKDPDLTEFCPLSQPKLLSFVLHLSKEYEIEHLKMNGNEMVTLKPLEALQGFKSVKSLLILDARKNNIENHEELDALKYFTLTQLLLSDNPMCEKLSEIDYVKTVKMYCPQIKKLDNVRLPEIGEAPMKRNFLCDMQGENFVDQFLEHFFTLYDSYNRNMLMNMYHRDAIFSITSHYVPGISEMSAKRFLYKKFCRNLNAMSDMSKSHEYLIQGSHNIGSVFKMLPETEHDPYTFTVDLMQYTEKCRMFSICGVFKEPGQSLLESEYFYSFTRTFILTPVSDYEYSIVNEMLHVTNATPSQQSTAFKVVKVPSSASIQVPDAKTLDDRNEMVRALVALTHLLPDWALKCLKEVNFNFKHALILFTDLFKSNKLPDSAFDFRDLKCSPTKVAAPPSQQKNIESIKSQLQPVEKLNKIIPAPSTSPAQPAQNRSYVPPKPIPAPVCIQITTLPETKVKKYSQLPERVLHEVIPLKETPKIQATSSPRSSAPEQPPKQTVQELAESVTSTPATLVAVSANPSKGITINLQKTKKDPLDAMDTDVGDFKKYVKDDIIVKALSMTLDTPISVVKKTLEEAGKQVTNKYTFGLKYYKAVGREFYRYNLCSDARNFLTSAMAIVPRKMGEQLYCLFTLFEIQFGDVNVAENMILIIAESFEINSAAVFMSQHLPKTNVSFARKVFGKIASSDLDKEKKKILLKSHVDFEIVFGNVDSLKYAKKIYQEIKASSQPPPETQSRKEAHISSKVPVEVQPTEIVADISKKKEVEAVVTKEKKVEAVVTKENKVEAVVTKETKVESDASKEKTIEAVGVTKKSVQETPSVNKTSSQKEAEKPTEVINFQEFRDRLLRMAKIMPENVGHEEVEEFLKLTDKQILEQQGEQLLRKYSQELYVIRMVLKKWQNCGSKHKVAKSMPDIKKNFPFDTKLINPLILYLKVREDLNNKEFVAARSKLLTHIKISHYIDIVQVFEDLMEDAVNQPELNAFLDSTLKQSVADDNQVPTAKIKLLMLIYLTFCRRIKSTSADALFKRHFSHETYFHPDDILENEYIRKRRSEYENKKLHSIRKENYRDIKAYTKDTFEGKIEEMRMYYYVGDANTARYRRNLFKDMNPENVKRFTLACSYFEALYGMPCVGMKHLRKAVDESISFICVSMVLNFKSNAITPMKLQLKQLISSVFRVYNPYVQELFYKYYQDWIKIGFDIFDNSFRD